VRSAPSGVSSDDDLPFGTLGRPHGVSGELVLHPYHAGGFRIDNLPLPLGALLVRREGATQAVIRSIRRVHAGFLLRLEGVVSREEASSLTGCELRLPRTALPPLREGEFYVEDLLGCVVQDTKGNLLGTVSGIFWNGAHDVMEVAGGERLFPIVPDFVVAFDSRRRIATIDLHE